MARRAIVSNNKLSSFVIPPLPKALPLPPLPRIYDEELYQRSITHTSLYQVARLTHDLETENYAQIQDYEKLEFMGDRILSTCVDLIVNEKHPNMRQGVSTMVHDNLVRNDTLAQLSDRYGITDQIKTSRDAQHVKRQLIKVKGSAFEAWIAGVFFDHLKGSGPDQASPGSAVSPADASSSDRPATAIEAAQISPAPLPATVEAKVEVDMSISPEPQPSEPCRPDTAKTSASASSPRSSSAALVPRTNGQALDYVFAWLKPLYLPLLDFTLDELRKYQISLEQDEEVMAVERAAAPKPERTEAQQDEYEAGGALVALTMLCENQYNVKPVWSDERAGPGFWRITCDLTLPDGRRFVTSAAKPTKKLAKAVASLYMCRELKIMKEKKAVVEPEAAAKMEVD